MEAQHLIMLSEGHFKHPQGFTQPFSRLKQFLLVLHEITESIDDLLIVAQMVKTYTLLMLKKYEFLKWHFFMNSFTGMQ